MKGIAAWALALGVAATAAGHGVTHAPVEGAVAVAFGYDDGTPMAWAEVRVFAPGEAEPAWEGGTDAAGRVAFVADRPGTWRVAADDGLGHRAEARIEVDAEGHGGMAARAARGPGRIAGGLGVLFGFFGLWAWARARALRRTG